MISRAPIPRPSKSSTTRGMAHRRGTMGPIFTGITVICPHRHNFPPKAIKMEKTTDILPQMTWPRRSIPPSARTAAGTLQ
jgi:hypothetical protein